MKLNVGVFFGGASVEHEISIISAVQAMGSLNREKFEVVPLYISKSGELYTGAGLTDIERYKDLDALLAECVRVDVAKSGKQVLVKRALPKAFDKKPLTALDMAFPIVHGTNCEDGALQGWFEVLGLPYVGCDVAASAVGMDKLLFKQICRQNGLPVVDSVAFHAKEWIRRREELTGEIAALTYPVVVKPVNLGSSVGISRVAAPDDLENAVNLALSFSMRVLVERAVTQLREINCSVLGDAQECEASVCEEPITAGEILSYEDKYTSKGRGGSKGMTSLKRKLPADISAEKTLEIQELSERVFRAVGASGVVRIDYLMDSADNDRVYVNEINTIPGSLSFYLWEATGMKYPELLEKLIGLAHKRARQRANLVFTYDTNILANNGLGGVKK
ncbi:MAG: D-alanine--D-alanine ligase [Oscillospiraceae bacterium]|jgi:D-alanine-D-alanine ligase|nr:D-alanine--D-alanine ligase [Oscillospiraceae bacterium]